ncbi:MAG: hypothetical protein ABIS84_03065 [Arachnia sp.]
MNNNFSDAFKSIVPEAPSSDGWAEGAHRKRRNRTRLVAGIAGAAVIALVVPVALSLGSNALLVATPPDPAAPSPDPAPNAPGAAACWDGPGQMRQATAGGASDGAVRAWLCGDAGEPEMFPGSIGPLEPLVDGVDKIVAFIQSQPTAAADVDCTAEYTLAYRIVLDYGDGARHVVPGALHGCRVIDDGGTLRSGGQGLYDLALDLWGQQRERVDAPGDVTVKQCPPPSRAVVPTIQPPLRPMLPLSPADAVTGFVCMQEGEGENWVGYSTTLQPDLVSLIARSVAADSVEGLGQVHLPTLVTITGPWGEALTLQRTPDDTFQWFDVGTPMLWKPSAALLAQLDAAIEAPPLTRPSSEPATQPTSVGTR